MCRELESRLIKYSVEIISIRDDNLIGNDCVDRFFERNRIEPLMIFVGPILQGQWFPDEFFNWAYDYSLSVCLNIAIAFNWL